MDTKTTSLIYEKLIEATRDKRIQWLSEPLRLDMGVPDKWEATNGYVTVKLGYMAPDPNAIFATFRWGRKTLEIVYNTDDSKGATFEQIQCDTTDFDTLLDAVRELSRPRDPAVAYIGFPGPLSAVEFLCQGE